LSAAKCSRFIQCKAFKGRYPEEFRFDARGAVGSGQVKFEAIKPSGSRVRLYPSTAVVTGRTEMSGQFG